MPKFFADPSQISKQCITLYDNDAKHIATVLRLQKGESLLVCNGQGQDYACEIAEVSSKEVVLTVLKQFDSDAEPHTKITLFQALPKADKMELILQKAVELGVHEIVPIATQRAIVKLDKTEKTEKKIQRWQKISHSAAEQSARGCIPLVHAPISFMAALQKAKQMDGCLLAYELEKQNTIRDFAASFHGTTLALLIGPEGGFSPAEATAATAAGCMPITLGKRILRTETAGIAAISILLYELG